MRPAAPGAARGDATPTHPHWAEPTHTGRCTRPPRQRVMCGGAPHDPGSRQCRTRPLRPERHTSRDGPKKGGPQRSGRTRSSQWRHPSSPSPTLQRPVPVTQADLAMIQLTQRRHLPTAFTGNSSFTLEQSSLERIRGEPLRIHIRNVSAAGDRRRCPRRRRRMRRCVVTGAPPRPPFRDEGRDPPTGPGLFR